MAPPDWQPWQTAAFLDAQRRRRPVLLLLEAGWSPASRDAHVDVFDRPDVSAAIAECTVPVRVDVDRRPDIADRYGLGLWPTLLLLTPDGEVLTGGTRLDASVASRIRSAAQAFAAAGDAGVASRATGTGTGGGRPAPPDMSLGVHGDRGASGSRSRPDAVIDVLAQVEDGLVTGEGGPATAATAAAALCALARAGATGDARWADLAAATIDAHDVAAPVEPVDDTPEAEMAPRRLEDEAEWVRVLARAVLLEPVPEWQAALDRRLETLMTFRRPDGLWRPWTGHQRFVLVDATARACRALMAAALARDDDGLAVAAIESLEAVAPIAFARGAGVSHVIEQGRPHGPLLLDDAMLLAHAALDADRWRGEPVYRDLADELVQTVLIRLAHPSGALVDRVASLAGAGQVGRLADAHVPLVGNAEAARLLVRLHPDDEDVRGRALRLLDGVHADARAAGLFAAPVGLARIGLGTTGAATIAW